MHIFFTRMVNPNPPNCFHFALWALISGDWTDFASPSSSWLLCFCFFLSAVACLPIFGGMPCPWSDRTT